MTVAQQQIQSFFRRWQNLEADKKAIQDDLRELFKEAKGDGYDTKAMRAAFRKVDQLTGENAADVQEHDAIVDLYVDALQPKKPNDFSHTRATREAATQDPDATPAPVGAESGVTDRRDGHEIQESAGSPVAYNAPSDPHGADKSGSQILPPPSHDDLTIPHFLRREKEGATA